MVDVCPYEKETAIRAIFYELHDNNVGYCIALQRPVGEGTCGQVTTDVRNSCAAWRGLPREKKKINTGWEDLLMEAERRASPDSGGQGDKEQGVGVLVLGCRW
jgi:hypothetical protein